MRLLFVRFLTKSAFLLFFIANLVGCDSQPPIEVSKSEVVDQTLCQFAKEVCEQSVNNQTVSLMINPVFTPSEKPLDIQLTFSVPVSDVQIRIEGRDMFMGVIPVRLETDDQKSFKGTAIYGSCSSNYMVWRTIVSYKQDGVSKSTWFDFLADNQ